MILDEPIEEEPIVHRKRWTWFEIFLSSLLFISIVISKTFREESLAPELQSDGYTLRNYSILISGTFLSIGYLIGNYWIDKPAVTNARTIIFSILYGIGFSFAAFSLVFLTLDLSGALEMSVISVILFLSFSFLDLITSIKKLRVASKQTYIRAAAFATILLVLNLINRL